MIVDVSSILKEVGGKVSVDGNIYADDTVFLGEEIHFNSFDVDGTVVNNGKSLVFSGVGTADVRVHCARCRKLFDLTLKFDIDETFIQGEADDDEDINYFRGYEINVDNAVVNAFFLNVPMRFLCSDDCMGICPVCGADLNAGDCGCSRDTIDPRWAAILEKLENTNKN